MGDGINLGSAFFSLGLNVGGLAQGITEAVADVSGFANRMTGSFGGIARASKAVDDTMFSVIKTSERYTRWLRDASPEMRRANEWLYAYRNQQERLDKQMAVTQERIKSHIASQKTLTESIRLQEAVIKERVEREKSLKLAYEQSEAAQNKLIQGGKATAQELQQMSSKVALARANWESASQAINLSRQRLETLQQSEATQASQLEVLKQRLVGLREEQHRANNSYALQKDTITSLKEKEKARRIEMEQSIQSSRRLYDENGRIIPQNARLLGSFNPVIIGIQKFQTVTGSAVHGVTQLGKSISGIGTVAIGTILANVTQGVAMNTQSIVQYGLDAYKSYELLGMSLTALSAREVVASGKFKDLASAQDFAKGKSKELIDWMQKLAIQSPFSVDDISGAFRLGNALGFTASQTQNLIAKTVDWAAATGATGEQITSVMRALGQMHNTGHVSLEDLNQLTDAGIGARDMLRDEFAPEIKKSKMSLEEMISSGMIPADRAINAISRSLGNDFAGGAEKAGASMTGLLNSIGDLEGTALREFFTRTFEVVQPMVSNIVSVLQDPSTIASISSFGNALGDTIGGALNWLGNVAFPTIISAVQTFGPMVMDAFSYLVAIGQEAYDWGYNIGNQFVQGLSDTVDAIMDVVSWIGDTISYWLEPHSPPKILPDIDIWGKNTAQVYFDSFQLATPDKSVRHIKKKVQDGLKNTSNNLIPIGQEAIQKYFSGWSSADFSVFDEIKKSVSDTLQGLVDSGNMSEKDLIPTILGSSDAIKRAIDDIRKTGAVSQDSFGKIQSSVGKTNKNISEYITSMLKVEQANRAVQKAQDNLSAVTDKYNKQLDPLRKKLEALNNVSAEKDRDKEIARLKSMQEAYASNGMQRDASKIQAQIEQLQTEKQIEQLERKQKVEEDAAAKKVSENQKIADQASLQLELQRSLIDQQKEQNELIRKQIELLKKKDSAGSGSGGADDLKKKEEAAAKKEEAAAKKAAAEEARIAKAEYEARLAAAGSEEEKLQIMLEEQSRFKQGTKEYLDMQKKIEVQRKKVANASEDAKRAEVDHNLAMADNAEKIKILQSRLSELNPESEEYAKRQEQLKKALEQQGNAQDKLNDAEFEAKLAGKDKATQLSMLKERLSGLTEGSVEYEKTLRRINSLEGRKERGAGGRGRSKKDKADAAGLGGPKAALDELKGKLDEAKDKIGDLGGKVTGVFDNISNKVREFRQSFSNAGGVISTFTSSLREWKPLIGAITAVLTVLVAHAFWVHLVVWAGKIAKLIGVVGGLFTPMNALLVVVALLGAGWAANFGGIQDVVLSVWNTIKEPLERVVKIISRIINIFQQDGIVAGFKSIGNYLPLLIEQFSKIGSGIWNGILSFTNSSDVQSIVTWVGGVFSSIWNWINSTGIPMIISGFSTIRGYIGEILSNTGSYLYEKVQEYIPIIIDWVVKMTPIFIAKLKEWGNSFISFISEQAGPIAEKLGSILSSLGQWLQNNGPGLAEKGVNAVIDLVIAISGWLLSTGIPWLIEKLLGLAQSLVPIIAKVVGWLGQVLPLLLSELTQLIGIVITRLGGWLLSVGLPRLFQLVLDLGLGLVNVILSLIRNLLYEMPGIFMAIGAALGRIIVQVIGIVLSLITTFVVNIPNYLVQIIVAILKFGNTLLSAFGTIIVAIGSVIASIFTFIGGLIVGGIYQLVQYGRMIVEGFSNGVSEGWNQFKQFFFDIWNSLVNWFKDFFGIHSPSTLFADFGKFLIDGLRMGMEFIHQLFADVLAWIGSFVTEGIAWFANMFMTVLTAINFFVTTFLSALVKWQDDVLRTIEFLVLRGIDFFTNLILVVTDKIIAFFADILSRFGISRDNILTVVDDLKAKVVAGFTWLKETASKLIEEFQKFITDTWNSIRDTATELWSEGADGIVGRIMGGVTKLGDKFRKFFMGQDEGSIQWYVKQAWDTIKETLITSWDEIGRVIGDKIDDMRLIVRGSINAMIDMANKAIDSLNMVPGVNIPHIPNFYKGTQFAPGGMAIVGENGPEMVQLPRGSEVMTNSRTMSIFEDMAKNVMRSMSEGVNSAMRSIEKAVDGATSAISNASQQQPNIGAQGPHTIITQNNEVKNERHDHWNLTVNTRATEGTVKTDFATMMSLAGV